MTNELSIRNEHATVLLVYSVQPDGNVAVSAFEKGRKTWRRNGQCYGIFPWMEALRVFSARETVKVLVTVAR